MEGYFCSFDKAIFSVILLPTQATFIWAFILIAHPITTEIIKTLYILIIT